MADLYRKDRERILALGTEILDDEGIVHFGDVIVRGEEEERVKRLLELNIKFNRVLVEVRNHGRWTAELTARYIALQNAQQKLERQVRIEKNTIK